MLPAEKRNFKGQDFKRFAEQAVRDQLVNAIRCDPPQTIRSLVEQTGLSQVAIRKRIGPLVDEGRVIRKKVGATKLLYPPDEGGTRP